MGQATWVIWATIKNYNHSSSLDPDALRMSFQWIYIVFCLSSDLCLSVVFTCTWWLVYVVAEVLWLVMFVLIYWASWEPYDPGSKLDGIVSLFFCFFSATKYLPWLQRDSTQEQFVAQHVISPCTCSLLISSGKSTDMFFPWFTTWYL